jgi:hypothetical protein
VANGTPELCSGTEQSGAAHDQALAAEHRLGDVRLGPPPTNNGGSTKAADNRSRRLRFSPLIACDLVARLTGKRALCVASLLAMTLVATGGLALATEPGEAQLDSHVGHLATVVFCHAGRDQGDGEYSDGAVVWVKNISCRQALALVKPAYPTIRHLTGRSGHFRLGKFSCSYKLEGPDRLEACSHGRAGFRFV